MFVATGREFPVDEYLRNSPLQPARVLRKGEIPPADLHRRPRIESSIVVLVSHDEQEPLSPQFAAAMQFLLKHEKELDRLRRVGAETLLFDFGYAPPDRLRSEVYVPPDLVLAMARFRMGMTFSVVRLPRG